MLHGYNFTERVRRVLAMSREEAARLHHGYVAAEHILLAILDDGREGGNVATVVLENVGIEPETLRERLLGHLRVGSPGDVTVAELPYTSRAKKTIELAMHEARELHHSYVGTEHLLLGLIHESKGIAAQVLSDAGCTLEKARSETLAVLGSKAAPAPRESGSSPPSTAPDQLTAMAPAGAPRLSSRALAVASAATLDAVKRRSRSVRAEHLLRALLDHGEGSAIAVLDRLGADRAMLRQLLDARPAAGDEPAGPETPLDNRELTMLLGVAEAERARSDAPLVATHHLLLAVLGWSDVGRGVFAAAKISVDSVRDAAAQISG